ncbi:hypothetical protein CEXT_172041 [Caerostris extrusa]|uniref:Uncharacterized protein n=1 Tax=Caerostris extrusa TaxID=172846 RepID=A0AAV4YFF1_CAEEX|nr:hypothetical protein CEXT_172041 [Caerostris extrusa]
MKSTDINNSLRRKCRFVKTLSEQMNGLEGVENSICTPTLQPPPLSEGWSVLLLLSKQKWYLKERDRHRNTIICFYLLSLFLFNQPLLESIIHLADKYRAMRKLRKLFDGERGREGLGSRGRGRGFVRKSDETKEHSTGKQRTLKGGA